MFIHETNEYNSLVPEFNKNKDYLQQGSSGQEFVRDEFGGKVLVKDLVKYGFRYTLTSPRRSGELV